MRITSTSPSAAAVLALAAGMPAAAQVTFTMLPMVGRDGNAGANAISGDGSTVVGYLPEGAARWAAGVPQVLAPFPGGSGGEAHAVSRDGRVVAGIMQVLPTGYPRAFRWAGAAQNLGVPPGWTSNDYTFGYGVSGDGGTVVGLAFGPTGNDGLTWTAAGGMRTLPRFPGGHSSEALAISADGSTIVGRATLVTWTTVACRWRAGAIEALPLPPGEVGASAYAVSADGEVVVGGSVTDTRYNAPERALLWRGTAAPRGLGLLPGDTSATVEGVSADGGIAVGYGSDEGPWTGRHRAFLWTAAMGMVELRPYLEAHGANLDGWEQLVRVSISADGRTLAGTGIRPNGFARVWVATLPPLPTCPADCDTSTGIDRLDIFDFLCFQRRYADGDPYACDCDSSTGPGACDVFDFLCFQNAYAAGCP